jgi:GTPase SAR1 family protein
MVYDLTDEESFNNINFWVSDLQKNGPENVVKVLVGNKLDLCEKENDEDDDSMTSDR